MFYITDQIREPGAQKQSWVARYICSNSQQYIVWVKIIPFSFIPKITRDIKDCKYTKT